MSLATNRKLLILDLDETLVYAVEQRLSFAPDCTAGPYYVYKRPHLDAFLAACLDTFRVAVWSSSSPLYCEEIVRAIFPDPARLDFVWAGGRCTLAFNPESGERYWRKNIRKVKRVGYRLEDVIAVDDTLQKWEKSYGNVVLVREFVGDPNDDELKRLAPYLAHLSTQQNIRAVDKLRWRSQPSASFQ